MAFTMPGKFTAEEAQEWLASNHESLAAADPKDFLCAMYGLKDALPNKPRVSKKVSPPPQERAKLPYNEDKCDARVYLDGGFAGQCTCKKTGGQFLCKRHQNEADKHVGKVKNGFFNAECPTHHYDNTDDPKDLISWHGVEMPEKKKKASKPTASGSQRKCGICGECGHNRSKCPLKAEGGVDEIAALKAALAKAEAKKAKKESDAEKSAVEDVLESVVEQVEQLELDEGEHDLTKEEQSAAGTGLMEQADSLGSGSEDEHSDDGGEDNSTHDCTFEGIPYTRDNENKVFDDDFEEVGEWDGKEIVFDSSGLKMHKKSVKYHKAENVEKDVEDL